MKDYTEFKYNSGDSGGGFWRGLFGLIFDLLALIVWLLMHSFKIITVIVLLLLGYYLILGGGL